MAVFGPLHKCCLAIAVFDVIMMVAYLRSDCTSTLAILGCVPCALLPSPRHPACTLPNTLPHTISDACPRTAYTPPAPTPTPTPTVSRTTQARATPGSPGPARHKLNVPAERHAGTTYLASSCRHSMAKAPPLAVPQLGSCTSSGRACWPRAARHSQGRGPGQWAPGHRFGCSS